MSEIVITEFIDEAARADLERAFDVHYDPGLCDDTEGIATQAADARALIVRNRTQVTGDLLARCPRLLIVGRLGVGLDNIDLDACAQRGVTVAPATGANVTSVAEYVVAAILWLRRGAAGASAEVLAGEWPRAKYIGREVDGAALGLIGFGGIGRAVAARASALGMRVAAFDPNLDPEDPVWSDTGVEPSTLPDLLAASDAVSLHVPLTQATRHLVNTAALAAMKPGAVLVNTARGGVVDERALAAALRDGALAGAMLDVFEDEPLGAGSHLDGVPNLFLTPHVAGVTEESNQRVGAMIAARVRARLEADQ